MTAVEVIFSGSKRVSRVGMSIHTINAEKMVKKIVQMIDPTR
jgi:hypothetical protein